VRVLKLSLTFVLVAGSLAAAAQQDKLQIGPGDLVHVVVFDTPELEQHPRISESGDAHLEFLGEIHLGGMTPSEAAREIEQKLIDNKLVLHPQVTVTIDQYATQSVSVLGEVHQPGSYQITAPRSVIDMIALAQGLNPAADRNITIKRHGSDGEKVTYFLSNNANTAFDKSVLVYPGDTVLVPKAGIVYVLGDVRSPGGFTMDDNRSELTALQMIAEAGGMNKTAVMDHTRLIRKNPAGGFTEIPLQVAKMQRGKEEDIPLQAGDIVYVPFSYVKGVALGAAGIAASVSGAVVSTHP
jgi:polysaccharide export outer membrane protein